RLVEKYGGTGAMTAGAERRLVRNIEREFDGFLDTVSRRRFGRVIGTAGTILSLGGLALGRKAGDVHQAVVPAPAMSTLRKRILALPLDRRQRLAGLEPRRAELAQVGLVLLDTVLGKLG